MCCLLKYPAKTVLLILFLFVSGVLQNCKGAECAALSSSISDADSDCDPDAADNCPFTYNPLQRDTNDNSIGDECEDEEAIVSLVRPDPATGLLVSYPKPEVQNQVFTPKLFKHRKTCVAYFVIGCHSQVIETFESVGVQNPLNDKHGAFGSLTGVCSAFNPGAALPPALYCLSADEKFTLSGYLTDNPAINKRFEPCATLELLDSPAEICLPE